MAYKFESGWEIGTFRGMYTGDKIEYTGFARVHLDTKEALYLDLQVNAYGCDKDWVTMSEAL